MDFCLPPFSEHLFYSFPKSNDVVENKLSNDSKWQGKGADSFNHSKRMGRGTNAKDKLLEAVKSGITKRRELLKQVHVRTGVA